MSLEDTAFDERTQRIPLCWHRNIPRLPPTKHIPAPKRRPGCSTSFAALVTALGGDESRANHLRRKNSLHPSVNSNRGCCKLRLWLNLPDSTNIVSFSTPATGHTATV